MSPTTCRPQYITRHPPQAIREGRHPADSPVKKPRGQTRGQVRLVPAPAPYNHDLRSVFIVSAASSYSLRLNPPPVTGTLAQAAVLGHFHEDHVLKQLLANVKTQLYRLSNRRLIRLSTTRHPQCITRYPQHVSHNIYNVTHNI
jgi:hypothetical protein